MSEEERDPPRLSGLLMDAARRDLPNDAQMMALAAKLGVIAGAAGGGGAAIGGASAGAAKAGAGAGVGAGAAGAKAGAVGAATVAAKGAGAGLAIKIVGAFVVAGAIAGGTAAEVSHVAHTRQEAAIAAASASAARISMAANTAQKPVNSLNPRPAQDPVVDDEPAPLPSASASIAPPTSKPDTSATADPAEEVKLLERAQDALRSRPADALALCDEHRAKFPRGSLAQEREVIAVEALVDLGRADSAKARADRFQQAYPTSTHVRRVRTLVGEN